MARLLGRYGKQAERITIKFSDKKRGVVVSVSTNPNKPISENGIHTGVLYNGLVRCNIHPSGLPEREWINDFEGFGMRTVTRMPI